MVSKLNSRFVQQTIVPFLQLLTIIKNRWSYDVALQLSKSRTPLKWTTCKNYWKYNLNYLKLTWLPIGDVLFRFKLARWPQPRLSSSWSLEKRKPHLFGSWLLATRILWNQVEICAFPKYPRSPSKLKQLNKWKCVVRDDCPMGVRDLISCSNIPPSRIEHGSLTPQPLPHRQLRPTTYLKRVLYLFQTFVVTKCRFARGTW